MRQVLDCGGRLRVTSEQRLLKDYATVFLFIKSQEERHSQLQNLLPTGKERPQARPTAGFLQAFLYFLMVGKGGRAWKEKRKGGREARGPKRPVLLTRPLGMSAPTQPPAKAQLLPIARRPVAPGRRPGQQVLEPGPQDPVRVPGAGGVCGAAGPRGLRAVAFADLEGKALGAASVVPTD